MMNHSVMSILMLLVTALFDINLAQTTCGSPCHCYCDEGTLTLDCSGLGISNITSCGSLDNFSGLVNFANNEITNLQTEVDGCSYDFSHNQIQSLEVFWQPYRPNCDAVFLNISHNVIQRLYEGAIIYDNFNSRTYGITQIVIDLSFNGMEYLEHGSISISKRRPLSANITIDLSFNKLLSISPTALFAPRHRLFGETYLLLNNNNLSNFVVSEFVNAFPSRYYLINLHSNNITVFYEEDIEQVVRDDVNLILHGNPWNCDCEQRYVSLNTSRLQRFLSNANSTQPICEVPYFVRGRSLLSLSEDELVCVPKLDQNANLDIHVKAGETLKLNCPVTGADPPITDVVWQIIPALGSPVQGEEAASLHVTTCFNCSLIINNIQKVLEGDYQCTVSNGGSVTIKQKVTVDDVITSRTEVYTTTSPTSPMDTRDYTIAAAKRPLLIAVSFLSVILIMSVICLTVVSYKLYKTNSNEIPLPQKGKTETSQNAPGISRYDDNVQNKGFDDKQEHYLEPNSQGIDSKEDIYELDEINRTYVNER